MNSDLYKFHLRSPTPLTTEQLLQPLSSPSAASLTGQVSSPSAPFCYSWNQGWCIWPFDVTTSTSASSVEESMSGSTAPFLQAQANVPGFLLQLALGHSSEAAGSLVVHSVNSFSSCLVPVSVGGCLVSGPSPVPKCTQVNVAVSQFFSSLISIDRVSLLVLFKFWVGLVNHPDRSAAAYVLFSVQFGFQVGFAGRTFLPSMIDLLSAFPRDDHPIRLNQEFWLDLAWWQELFPSWEGFSFFLTLTGPLFRIFMCPLTHLEL